MFTQKELSILAEALDFFIQTVSDTPERIGEVENVANKVVSLQEAECVSDI